MEMDVFTALNQKVLRQGPGCKNATSQAYALLKLLPSEPRILDIGCGSGVQTLELAQLSQGYVVGLDTYQPFLRQLAERAARENLAERVEAVQGSMFALDFPAKSFDLIWSEGAIFIIGFAKGLREWQRFLKPGGYLAVTDVSWLQPNPPLEPVRFWRKNYPSMKPVADNLELIRAAGYQEIGHFTLSEQAWWDEYYQPLQAKLEELRPFYHQNEQVLAVFEAISREIEMYQNYSRWYGYEFYLMQLPQ